MRRVLLELAAETSDVLGHRRGLLPLRRRSPDSVQELLAIEDVTRTHGQVRQQVELLRRQTDPFAGRGHLPCQEVDVEAADAEQHVVHRVVPASYREDAGGELPEVGGR